MWETGESGNPGGTPRPAAEKVKVVAFAEDEPAKVSGSSSFSLDELEDFSMEDLSDLPSLSEDAPAPAGAGAGPAEASEGEEKKTGGRARARIYRTKIIAIGGMLLFLVVSGVAGIVVWRHHGASPSGGVHGLRSVTRSITIPYHDEDYEFFLLSQANQEKDVFTLEIALQFMSPSLPQEIQKEPIMLRDTIYLFLRTQQPSKNTQSVWEKIVERDLFEYIKDALPASHLKAIHIKHLQRL
jgi:flagellar basal body-associated protein FliL